MGTNPATWGMAGRPKAMLLLLLCALLPRRSAPACVAGHPAQRHASLPLCKMYEGRDACCSPASLTALRPTFEGLGHHFDRCTSCRDNWEHVLCVAACSAEQHRIVDNSSAIDPTLTKWGEERLHTPLTFTLRMHEALCDKLWYSCEADDTNAWSADRTPQTIHFFFNDNVALLELEKTNSKIKSTFSEGGLSARKTALDNSFGSFANFTESSADTVVAIGTGLYNAGDSIYNSFKRKNATAAKNGRRLFCEVMSAKAAPGLGLSIALQTQDPRVLRQVAAPQLSSCGLSTPHGAASAAAAGGGGGDRCAVTNVSNTSVTVCTGGTYEMPAAWLSGAAVSVDVFPQNEIVGVRCAGYANSSSSSSSTGGGGAGSGTVTALPGVTCWGGAAALLQSLNASTGLLNATRTRMYGGPGSTVLAGADCAEAYFDCGLCYTRIPDVELKLSQSQAFNLDIVVPAAAQCNDPLLRHGAATALLPGGADLAAGQLGPGQSYCLNAKDLEASDPQWNGYEFCYLQQNNKVLLSRSAGHTMEYVFLLVIGGVLANLVRQSAIAWFPPCLCYVVVGAMLGAIALSGGKTSPDDLKFDTQFFTFFLLPPIIFAEGFTMNIRQFTANAFSILMYAIPGTLISTLTVAVVLFWSSESLAAAWQFPELSFNEALAFAAMICAVDPVATCDTFNELKVDHQLEILVVGESLVNDAAAIVLFKTFKEWVLFEDTQNNVTALGAIGDFSYFVFVSCIIGLAVGVACSLLYKHISFKDNPGLEITIFLLLSYSTFLVAEFWHCSGILSSLVGGVVMSSYAQRNLTDFDESLGAHSTGAKGMLQMLAALANMVIFLMVGMALVVCMDSFNLLFTLLVLVFTLVARALAVFPLTYVINMVTYARSGGTGKQIPWSHAVMMWWSGLRGAVALALAVDMPSRHRYMFTSTTCVLIAVTALFYGGRTPAMLKRLKVATGVPHDDGQDWNIGSNARGVAKWNEKVVEPLLISKAYRKQRKQRASVAAAAEGEKQDAAATAQELAGARRKLASLTALLEETQKDAIDYSRNKERQIESIYRQVDRDASKRTRCCGARLLMMVANFLLFLAGCAGLVVGILMLASEFAVGAVRTAALVLFVACIVIMLISFLGFTGAATRSNWWLVPYTVLLLGAMTLEVFALALAFDYNATLRRASASDFDAAKVEAVVGVLGAVRDIDAMAHVREVANITFVASGCASSVHYANATATGGGLLALSCSASAWVDGFVGSKCTARQPNATAFVSCRRAHHTEMRSNTDLYCACRDGVVALLEENTKLMAAVGCGLAGFQLLLVVFSCALITARFFGEHEEHDKEHLNDELYLDKDVIKVTKKLAEAKDSAIARLQKERQKEQAKQKKLQKQDKKKNSPKKKKKSDAREVLVETGHKVIV